MQHETYADMCELLLVTTLYIVYAICLNRHLVESVQASSVGLLTMLESSTAEMHATAVVLQYGYDMCMDNGGCKYSFLT